MPNELVPVNRSARQLLRRGAELADHALARNTQLTYAAALREYRAFCDLKRIDPPLPASPAAIISYVTFLLEDAHHKVSTIAVHLAALRYSHLQARVADPTADPAVDRLMKSIARDYGKPPERVRAVALDELRLLLRAQPATLAGARNRALLLVGYSCDMRRSELVALRVQDVEFRTDRMVVTIARSKTDQAGQGYQINVPRITERLVDPVRTLRTWLEVAKIRSGPIFRKVDRWEHVGEKALTDQVVADIVKSAVAAAGLQKEFFSGHSLRRGLITQASRNREDSLSIRKVSRHKTERMVDVYVTEAADTQMRVIAGALGVRGNE